MDRTVKRGPEKRLYIIRIDRGYARIIRFNVPEEGDHCKEELLVSSDFSGVIALRDVSEGIHRCRFFVFDRGIPAKTIAPENGYWQTKCPICSVIQKNEEGKI